MASVSVGGFQLEFKIRFLKHVIRTNYIHYNKCIQTEFVHIFYLSIQVSNNLSYEINEDENSAQ